MDCLSGHGHGKSTNVTSDDDSSNNDAASVMSEVSDDVVVSDNEVVDGITAQDVVEDELRKFIDELTQKNAKGRIVCFNEIGKFFGIKYLPEFVEDRKDTITDGVERGLKKGRSDERCTAAKLSTLLCIQLGAYDSAEIVCKSLKSTLTFIANDNSASNEARAEVRFFFYEIYELIQ